MRAKEGSSRQVVRDMEWHTSFALDDWTDLFVGINPHGSILFVHPVQYLKLFIKPPCHLHDGDLVAASTTAASSRS